MTDPPLPPAASFGPALQAIAWTYTLQTAANFFGSICVDSCGLSTLRACIGLMLEPHHWIMWLASMNKVVFQVVAALRALIPRVQNLAIIYHVCDILPHIRQLLHFFAASPQLIRAAGGVSYKVGLHNLVPPKLRLISTTALDLTAVRATAPI